MADTTIQMQVAPTQEGGEKLHAFEYSESLAGAGDTKLVLIPDDVKSVLVTAQAAGGASAMVYTSTDLISVLKSGSGITWVAWTPGAVTSAQGAVFMPVTAIKMTQSGAGTSKLTVRSQ